MISCGSRSLGSVLLRNCLTGREESVAKDEENETSRNDGRRDDGNGRRMNDDRCVTNERKSERVTAPNVRGPFRLFVLSSNESSKTKKKQCDKKRGKECEEKSRYRLRRNV